MLFSFSFLNRMSTHLFVVYCIVFINYIKAYSYEYQRVTSAEELSHSIDSLHRLRSLSTNIRPTARHAHSSRTTYTTLHNDGQSTTVFTARWRYQPIMYGQPILRYFMQLSNQRRRPAVQTETAVLRTRLIPLSGTVSVPVDFRCFETKGHSYR